MLSVYAMVAAVHAEAVKSGTNLILCDSCLGSNPRWSISPWYVANKRSLDIQDLLSPEARDALKELRAKELKD